MASQIYSGHVSVGRGETKMRPGPPTCRAACWIIAALSVFENSSFVFTFLIKPSARAIPRGTLSSVSGREYHQLRASITHTVLVKALPRICILVLDSGSACDRGSYKPSTGLAELSSLSWSSFNWKSAE